MLVTSPSSSSIHVHIAARLRAAGCVFAEDEAVVLVASARTPAELEDWVARRVAGAPLEHVVGHAAFCGLRIAVEPGVFVPRRRTELLAREAISVTRPGQLVVDLCCGSGAVAAAVAAAVEGVDVHAVDIDAAAVACARRNLRRQTMHVHHGDLFAALPRALEGRVEVLVVNAPYVPSGEIALLPREARAHEPWVALDGGHDGLSVHRRVAAGARRWLAPRGHVLVETSARQAAGTHRLLARVGLEPTVVRDEELDATVVIGRRPASVGRRSEPLSRGGR